MPVCALLVRLFLFKNRRMPFVNQYTLLSLRRMVGGGGERILQPDHGVGWSFSRMMFYYVRFDNVRKELTHVSSRAILRLDLRCGVDNFSF